MVPSIDEVVLFQIFDLLASGIFIHHNKLILNFISQQRQIVDWFK